MKFLLNSWKFAFALVTVVLSACGGGGSSTATTEAATDSIKIVSVTPSSVVAGQSTIFTVEVAYSLITKDSGLLGLGFNTDKVDSYVMASSQEFLVSKGSGTHVFTAAAVPKNWGSAGVFQAYANISENPHPATGWKPLANATKDIPVSDSATSFTKTLSSQPLPMISIQCSHVGVCL